MKKYIILFLLLSVFSLNAQIKISQLPALTGTPNTSSTLPIVDYTTSITKKITISDLLTSAVKFNTTSYVPLTSRKSLNVSGGLAYKIPYQISADSTGFVTTPTDKSVLHYTTAGSFNYLTYASTTNTANALIQRGASGEFTAGTATLGGEQLNGALTQSGNYAIQNNFTSGFSGTGYRLDYGVMNASKSSLEVDVLTVRGIMSVYELLIRQVRTTNGNMFVSAGAQIDSVVSSTSWIMKDPSGGTTQPFANGDILLIQKYNNTGSTIKQIFRVVNGSPSGKTVTITTLAGAGDTGVPAKGDDVTRIGNNGNTANRDGSIYLASDDTYSPYMRILSGVTNYTNWGDGTAIKAQFGNLAGTYGYGTTQTYGVAMGQYGSGYTNVTVDATNGFRIRNNTTTIGQWDNTGNILVGQIGSGKNNIYITADSISLRTNTTSNITLASAGTGYFRGNITSTATITGGVVQTASSGQRVYISGTTNDVRFYNSTNSNYFYIQGSYSSPNDKIIFGHSVNSTQKLTYLQTSSNTNILSLSSANQSIGCFTDETNSAPVFYAEEGGIQSSLSFNHTTGWTLSNGVKLITDGLRIGVALEKFTINSTGQITKVDNIAASGNTGKVLQSDGTSFSPATLSVAAANVTGLAAVATSGSYSDLNDQPNVATQNGNNTYSGSISLTRTAVTLSGAAVDVSGKNFLEVTPTAIYQEISNFTNGSNSQIIRVTNAHASYTLLFQNSTYIQVGASITLSQWDTITFIYSPGAAKWICLAYEDNNDGA